MSRDGGEVGLKHRSHMRLLGHRAGHVIGDGEAHPVVGDVLRREVTRLSRGWLADADDGRGGDGEVNVLAGDAAVAACAIDARRVDAVLQAGAADRGTETGLTIPQRCNIVRPERSRRALLRR